MSSATRKRSLGILGVGVVTALLATAMPAADAAPSDPTDVTLRAGDIDFSETRANGHNEFLRDGLHVWTDGSTDTGPRTDGGTGDWNTDKAAGYWAAPTGASLSTYADGVTMKWIGTQPQPGLQIVFDADTTTANNDYNILVGEPVYGGDWWLTGGSSQTAKDVAPSTTGGSGSEWHGTLAQWAAVLPSSSVSALGYSLGSGVKGDGLIRSVTTPDTRYLFTSDATVETVDLDGTVTVKRPKPRTVKLVLRANTLEEDQVAAAPLRWKVKADGKVVLRTKQSAGDVNRPVFRFAKGTGKHTLEVYKNGTLATTVKVRTS